MYIDAHAHLDRFDHAGQGGFQPALPRVIIHWYSGPLIAGDPRILVPFLSHLVGQTGPQAGDEAGQAA